MTGTLTLLSLAALAFLGSHFLMSSQPVRDPLVKKLGQNGFLSFYTIVSIPLMVWLVLAYSNAPEIVYWEPPTYLRHWTLSFMIVACIFFAASLTPKNPTLAGTPKNKLTGCPMGIFRITRHPMMWGIGIWGLTHLLAKGDGASFIFFGAMTILALLGPLLIDRRKARLLGDEWQEYAAQSSYIPFAAIISKRTKFCGEEISWLPVVLGAVLYLSLLILHETLFGIAPMSWVSNLFD
jgi:uncharacterized membrane protein